MNSQYIPTDTNKIDLKGSKNFKNMPDSPGVYFFMDGSDILYIGRATSLRDRVKSYFKNDLIETRGQLLVDMVARAHNLEWQEADSVLEAIILESNLIKEHQPYYNTKEKDDRSYNYVIITDETFPRVIVVRGRELEKNVRTPNQGSSLEVYKIKKKFGPYPQGGLLREALSIIRKIFPFRDARARLPHNEAFYQSIGLSPDTSSPEAMKEYAKTIRHLTLFFEGKKKALIRALEKEMKMYAKAQQFEKAQLVKKTLYALGHIQDVSLIKKDYEQNISGRDIAGGTFRIEAYDVAHLGGSENVGVMTVIEDGQVVKDQYRKFKISLNTNDDVGSLTEILERRLKHTEWHMPNIIVVDGGKAQINAAEKVLAESGFSTIPVVSVLKDEHHKPKDILTGLLGSEVLGNEVSSVDAQSVRLHRASILMANAEAHRFAISFHRKRLSKKFLE